MDNDLESLTDGFYSDHVETAKLHALAMICQELREIKQALKKENPR
jgi:uncharacterized protein YoaH (UPF0181 family)